MRDRLLESFIALLILAGCGFILYASGYVHPNAEEILLAQKSRDQGILQAAVTMLQSYDGRYFTNILHGLSPLAFDWYEGYRLVPFLLLIFVAAAATFLLTRLFSELKFFDALRAASLAVLLLVAIAPSLPHTLFCYATAIIYFVPWGFLFVWVALYLAHLRQPADNKFLLGSAAMLFLGNGLSEVFLVYNLCALLLLGYITRSRDREKLKSWITLSLVFAGSSLFFVSSPGITERLNDHAEFVSEFKGIELFLYSVREFGLYQKDFFFGKLIILPGCILAGTFLVGHLKLKRELSAIRVSIIFIAAILLSYSATLPYYLSIATRNNDTDRIYNAVYFGNLLLCVFIVLLFLRALKCDVLPGRLQFARAASGIVVALCIIFSINNFRSLKEQFSDGSLQRFDTQVRERLRAIQEAKSAGGCTRAYFMELTVRPSMIWYNTDLVPNRAEPVWNRAYERYFHVDEVRIVGDTTGLFKQAN